MKGVDVSPGLHPAVTWRCCPDLTIDATLCRYGRGEATMGARGIVRGVGVGRGGGRGKSDKEGVHVGGRASLIGRS